MGAFLLPCKLCQVLGCLRGIRSSTLHNIYSANLWKSVSLFPSSATTSLENVWIDGIMALMSVCGIKSSVKQYRENVWNDGVDVGLECGSKSTPAILGSFLRIRWYQCGPV